MTSTLTEPGCGCGCDGERTCELRAPVRPRFFCGQLLTDQDLSGLAAWVKDKRALARYREGWGVVCGLDVRADPDRASGVVVRPGHAVSSCGEDVVVAGQAAFDLGPSCPAPAPCATPGEEPPPDDCVLDLGVAYAEVADDPVVALGRSACGQAGECENSRIVESFRLVASRVLGGAEPDRPDWRRWQEGYAEAVSPLERAEADGVAGDGVSAADRLAWLRDRIRDHPLAHFGFVEDWLTQSEVTPARFVSLLYWLVQDRLLSFYADGCPPGCAGEPVPLARIWLHRTRTPDGRRQWVVKAVDPGPPYRRPFGPAGWPAGPGKANLGQVVWHRPEDACLEVKRLGVTVSGTADWPIPSTVDEIRRMLGSPPVSGCGDAVTLRTVAMPDGAFLTGARVVGFVADPATEKAAPRVSKATRRVPPPKPARRRTDGKP
ncbi:hypothetical protein [Amycolatopsis sp. NPDC021455]|uniref:hypothetical protein n=1 Tax=Amycolatopsis sp. NPDC021455 TaxID=3154901 RepID=UPI00341112B5